MQIASKKMQLHAAIGIDMGGGEQLGADDGLHVELLAELAVEARRVRFVGIAFSARKLPIAFEVNALLAPCHQETPVAFHDRGRDDDGCHLPGVNG